MRLHFLGGANEVGASCLLLEVAGQRLLVDAGIRMQKRDGSQLPDLSRLQEGGPLDAVLLTHAHTDHIGALPMVHLAYHRVPIFTTEPTKALSRVLLQDSLRLMESRWEQEEEIPLYPPHAVEGMLARMSLVSPGQPVQVAESIVATYVPSGHILGACSITLDTPEGVILLAGDYSTDRQHTIEGMTLPKQRPDLMITESTYGNRIHSNRRKEEERLCAAVAEVVGAGGKVLIPSFALGRAQEVILILLEAQRRGHLPQFPLFVDGMVKTMCAVYSQFPESLQSSLRRWVETAGSPFFYVGGAQPVLPPDRAKVLKGPPCVIVASSGMLTGRASRIYAVQMVSDKKNAIFITGYQDEESPGHHLLALAQEVQEKGEGFLRLDGVTRRVSCQVNRYGLSAHADAGQMLNVICRMDPKHVVLVHGDDEARQALSTTFPATMKVHLPGNGDYLELPSFRRQRDTPLIQVQSTGLAGADEPLHLAKLQAHLLQKDGPGRRYTIQELAQVWHGQAHPDQAEALRQAIADAPQLFQPDRHRPFLFSVVSVHRAHTPSPVSAQKGSKNDTGQVIKQSQALLGHLPDLEKIGTRPEQKAIVLSFAFPDRAVTQHHDLFLQLSSQTGWAVEVSPRADHAALTRAVREALPLTWDIVKVAIFPQEKRVKARLRLPSEVSPQALDEGQKRYLEVTGRLLEIEELPDPEPPKVLFDEHGRMEQNAAYTRIRKALVDRGLALLSFSRKGEPAYLELGLISPQIAATATDLVAQLSQETGWQLRLRNAPNQQAIITRARQLMPTHTSITTAVAVGSGPFGICCDPFGRYVYVCNYDAHTVSMLSIGANGALTTITTAKATATHPHHVCCDPTGRYVFLTNVGSNTVSQFAVNANGSLTNTTVDLTVGSAPMGVDIDPTGRYVYCVNSVSNTVSQLSVGQLVPLFNSMNAVGPGNTYVRKCTKNALAASSNAVAGTGLASTYTAIRVVDNQGNIVDYSLLNGTLTQLTTNSTYSVTSTPAANKVGLNYVSGVLTLYTGSGWSGYAWTAFLDVTS